MRYLDEYRDPVLARALLAEIHAADLGLANFSLLVSHVLVPPAMSAILDSAHNEVQAFLAAGHVCAIMGWTAYEPLAARCRVPIVVTGFEPLELLEGILLAIRQLEAGAFRVENQYVRGPPHRQRRGAAGDRAGLPGRRPHLARDRCDPGQRPGTGPGRTGTRARTGIMARARRLEDFGFPLKAGAFSAQAWDAGACVSASTSAVRWATRVSRSRMRASRAAVDGGW
ncbi:hypothetical protein Plo01_65100 [Planobispora longispora]|uniref:Uncharacterized protein n=1 Tax=Planobispora longispora TaxID=28887 RepID=A0A8J3RNV2_9ACTN|nr:hypothetical protein GCM10020093_018890 [Planobispora longispora]GIH80081.1 hypothetical protein Plo01_65100 [Planobispora longispora]